MPLTLQTPVYDLHENGVAGLSAALCRKLAKAAASFASRTEASRVNVEDLLGYLPMRYEDRSNMMPIDQLYDGLESSVELFTRVSGGFQVGKSRPRSAPPLYIFEVTASDKNLTGRPVVVWWFISGKSASRIIDYWRRKFGKGTRFVAYGKWEWDNRRNTFALKLKLPDELEILPDPEDQGLFEDEAEGNGDDAEEIRLGDDDALKEDAESPGFVPVHVGRRVPVYRKLGPFKTKRLREIFFDVLSRLEEDSVRDTLPEELRSKLKLIGRYQALREIHFPPEESDLRQYAAYRSEAHRRLIFEEFFRISFALQAMRTGRREEKKGAKFTISGETRERMKHMLPFELTGAQKRVVSRIFEDMQSESPMNRLIQGDVGCGKTVVAFLAMFAAMESGYQAALMAPTEILAEQHARNAAEFFSGSGYRTELLIGSLKSAEKKKLQKAVSEGEINAVIGTQALIQDKVSFSSLGLAIIDEQHRFGVLQRAQLKESGFNPDVLVMTATPIPRSLAMTVYGDLDVSLIDELPPGRTPVKTVVVGEDKRKGVYKGIEREVARGRQAYVVYPLVEESEKLDLKDATRMYEELRDKIFPKRSVGLIHGKLKSEEKEAIMAAFTKGDIDILVSTTVIEVGVDVPNASLMVIEHAERFGLSQLHQLRGRVGRGSDESFCVLLTGDKKTAVARERLGIMEETSDGFKIAEKDLEIRGQGEILGTRQSGMQGFRIGNIIRDLPILEAARAEAERYLHSPELRKEAGELMKDLDIQKRFRLGGIG